MSIIVWAQQSPVTNQAEHLWHWTYLYALALPAIVAVGLWKAWRERQAKGPAKLREEHRYASFSLDQQRQTLIAYREYVERTGQSPVGGKSAEQAIADQEALVRSLNVLQSDLQTKLPPGGQRNNGR